MGKILYELTGQTFGLLEVLGEAKTKDGKRGWSCLCHGCGRVVVLQTNRLTTKHQRSCGCKRAQGGDGWQKRYGTEKEAEAIDCPDCTLPPNQRSGDCVGANCKRCGWNRAVHTRRTKDVRRACT